MARILSIFVALMVASSSIVAAPVSQRALQGCGLDRFNIVSSLAETGIALAAIDKSDPATAAAVKTAESGLTSSGEGIAQIALALVTGGAPPASARNQTQQGLLDAQTALQSINGTDVSDALTKLSAAIQDGNDVVADCQAASSS
ncbi:hypothetical protein HMN09_00326400 [Mycena chlorophos]|uniref:Uncharacterized protein n=2 Tax=Mycena chlorophos TaxID=658473 RepID=A0A146I5E4_MYCCL|nr:hypothetical protein HMN09_00326400 [Mycena chlorophos]GAT54486.1 predicted protein [Mycena chlorophos]